VRTKVTKYVLGNQEVNLVHLNVVDGISGDSLSTDGAGNMYFVTPLSIADVQALIAANEAALLTTSSYSQVFPVEIASYVTADFSTKKLIIEVKDLISGDIQSSKILISHNTTSVFATEYAIIHSSVMELALFTISIVGTNVKVYSTASSANLTEYKVYEITSVL